MKRIIYSFSMMAALFCFASCSEKMNLEQPDVTNKITVTTQVDPHTKAGYETSETVTVLPEKFYIEIDQDGNDKDYRLPLTREPNTNNYQASIELQWKGTDHTNTKVKAMTIPYGLTSVDMENPMAIAINKEQSNPENLKASDLLGASTTIGGIAIQDNNINIAFKHLMSKLQITYTKPDDIQINSVQLKNTCVRGGYSYASMAYVSNIAAEFGDITMYHEAEKKSAEAIFFPYTPTSDPKLVVNATINGQTKAFECPIVLKQSSAFVGGKRYIMTVTVSETGIEGVMTMIKDWNASSGSTSMANERILWIGTSIPHGATKEESYPKLVSDALGCEVINNAIGGSLVTMQKDASWIETPGQGWNVLIAGALSQKIDEAKSIYANRSQDEINQVVSMSYESLIMPYINGSTGYPQCSTVIIDHGYNDLSAMLFERNAFNYGNEPFRSYTHLMQMIERGEEYYNEYYANITSDAWNNILYPYGCYIVAMKRIIDDIKSTNPNVKIIIGNYFTLNNPLLTFIWQANNVPDQNGNYPFPDYEHYAELICYSNEAVASACNLDIVNVYEHLYIEESMFCNLGQNYLNNLSDPTKFCPDGVHPTNEYARDAIADIWIRALRDILR